jgi:hypothetical protein
MDDWAKVQQLGHAEMTKWPIGTKVQLRMLGGKIRGKIIEHQPPIGLLQPRYKCKWDNGDESGFLPSSDLIKI